MNEYAIIGKLKLSPVEDAKTLQMAFYEGMPFAVSKDYNEDDLYVIFLPDGQISEEYAKEHDLVGYADPETGEKKGGFFAKNRKVRTQSFMQGQLRSVGYVAPLETLKFTGYDLNKLEEGMSFNELNGVPICNKFVNKATRNLRNQQNKSNTNRREEVGLTMHQDTNFYYKNKRNILPGDLITITLKLDGTSFRCGEAYEAPPKLPWWKRLIMGKTPQRPYTPTFLAGTRRVILQRTSGEGFYGNHSIYLEVAEKLEGKLMLGESVYGEIVGWQDEHTPLFKRGGMVFKYGTLPGERQFYIYNIKWTLPNGQSISLPWTAVQHRAKELGFPTVPTVVDTFSFNGDIKELDKIVDHLTEGDDLIDPSHIREGIVLRVDRGLQTTFLKSKGEAFYALEDKAKSDESFVDLEELQDI